MNVAPPLVQPPGEFDGYRLSRLVGRGAMGEVYLAHDTVLDRAVAVKFLTVVDPGPAARERFLIEARAIARLSHPNVVAVHRVGEVAGRPYLVSEFIRGRSLDKLERAIAPAELVRLAAELAAGLAAAHRRGVLHRDLKPGNVLLSDDGELKLCDFGLAKLQAEAAADAPAPAVSVPVVVRSLRPADLDATPIIDLAETAPAARAALPATPDLHLTRTGALIGTPLYMAPELWQGAPATVRSDLYALGAILYQLAAGRPPYQASDVDALQRALAAGPPEPLAEVAPATPPALAALVDRCLRPDPAERPASAEEVRVELAQLAAPPAPPPAGGPYRGLRPFDAEHRAVFFGRRAETLALVEQLRAEALVVVAGDSGVGKSSLCRAGVLPLVEDGALGERRTWTVARFVPGRRPRAGLAAALALDDAALLDDPRAVPRALVARLGAGRGLCLYVDQLDELVTEAAAEERAPVAEVLAELAARVPGVRVLMSVRSDFLTRVAALPGLGRELSRALYLVGPLAPAERREAIVGPARAAGVRFESDALVDTLVSATDDAAAALPLLQFALAELWERRDVAHALIPAQALAAIGGVAGALARHADGVLAALAPGERAAARRMLAQLVTTQGTRAHRGEAELVGDDRDAAAALAALVRGRLVAARASEGGTSSYELAHEALLSGWTTLRGWLDADAARRVVHERLALAAAEWERLGGARAGLWDAPQLSEARRVELDGARLAGRERAFLSRSRAARRRQLFARGAMISVVPLLAAGVWAGTSWKTRADRERAVAVQLGSADEAARAGAAERDTSERLRGTALAAFERGQADAEPTWERATAAATAAERHWRRAAQALEAALQLDAGSTRVRARLADVLLERAHLAEAWHKSELLAELLERVRLYDDGGARWRAWTAPGSLHLTLPAGAHATIQPYVHEDGLARPGAAVDASAALAPGSYLATVSLAGAAAELRYPFVLRRGERLDLSLADAPTPPAGFVYVPPGRFRYGSAADDDVRRRLLAMPEHDVTTPGYFIARHEVTFADWIAFLDALPDEERAARRPSGAQVDLAREADGRWRVTLAPSPTARYTALAGEPLHYAQRDTLATQDWRQMPVSMVSPLDARRYAAWLDASGRVPGARLCSEYEWERAARGADGRAFPPGDSLPPTLANVDATYGRKPGGFGVDEVGRHPGSDSPFGVSDLAGNVWEIVESVVPDAGVVIRGGGFYQPARNAQSNNRSPGEESMRVNTVGVRLCASVP